MVKLAISNSLVNATETGTHKYGYLVSLDQIQCRSGQSTIFSLKTRLLLAFRTVDGERNERNVVKLPKLLGWVSFPLFASTCGQRTIRRDWQLNLHKESGQNNEVWTSIQLLWTHTIRKIGAIPTHLFNTGRDWLCTTKSNSYSRAKGGEILSQLSDRQIRRGCSDKKYAYK